MRINDFEKMQQDLYKMKNNLNDINHSKYSKKSFKTSKRRKRQAVHNNFIKNINLREIAKEEKMIFMATIVIIIITIFFSTNIFAQSISNNMIEKRDEGNIEGNIEEVIEKEKIQENKDDEFVAEIVEQPNEEVKKEVQQEGESIEETDLILENNVDQINLEEILLENVSILKSKEYAEEIRDVEFEIEYNDNPNLPEGTEVVTEQGKKGTEQITVIKSFENNELVSEDIINATPLEMPISQKVDVGTSKFLADNKVYIGDTMYVTEEVSLKSNITDDSEEICTIPKYLDIKLQELSKKEKWCKVEYEGLEGYVQSKYLTSSEVTPEIIEKNRIQKIKINLNEGIMLN